MTSLREPQKDSQQRSPGRKLPPSPARRSPRQSAIIGWQWLTARFHWLARHWQSLGNRQKCLEGSAVLVVLALVTTYVVSNFGGSPTGNPAGVPTGSTKPVIKNFSPAHRSSSSDTPEAAVAAIRLPRELANVLKKWNPGRGGAALAAVSSDLGSATQAAGAKRYVLMRPACSSLATAAKEAQAAPPIPDTSMQRLYVKALTTLGSAATVCLSGIDEHAYGDDGVETHENPALLSQAVSEFTLGARELYSATLKIEVAERA